MKLAIDEVWARLRRALGASCAGAALAAGPCNAPDTVYLDGTLADAGAAATVRLNQLQVLGTHNSYHIAPEPDLLAAIAGFLPDLAATLEYSLPPIEVQLERGVRQLEFDVFLDPQGGLYANRAGLAFLGRDPASGSAELGQPGLKVLHTQDLDFQSHCLTFVRCLTVVKEWSDAHPDHVPIMIMIETKQETVPDLFNLGFAIPLPFGPAELDQIDAEIRSVFDADELIVPDDVRGDYETLEQAVLGGNWPALQQARGRVFFTFLHGGGMRDMYVAGHPSLSGRVMFATADPGTPEASFFNRNTALASGAEIAELVRAGYLVRTRSDIDTREARSGDTALREAAFASGAQYVSTDFVEPEAAFGTGYFVELPGGGAARCNPVNAPPGCDVAALEGAVP